MTNRRTPGTRQRGAVSLLWVVVLSGLFAAVAMALLFSLRQERNLFAETWQQLGTGTVARQALGVTKDVAEAPLRKCIVDGRPMVSNTDCSDRNPSTRRIDIQVTRGVEAPRPAAPAVAAPSSDPMLDKIIEKQLH